MAWAFVAHTDSHFDPEALRRFVRAYQKFHPLTIGELWAVAITLRIVLVENLRRAADRIVSSRAARQERTTSRTGCWREWATADRIPSAPGTKVDALSPAFVVQVVKRLRDQDPRVTPALKWLEEEVGARGMTAEAIVRDEHQRQGASNVTVRNIITSMRFISEVEWSEFFEDVSLVDEVLRSGRDFARWTL